MSGNGKTNGEKRAASATVDVIDCADGCDNISDENTLDDKSDNCPIVLSDYATSDEPPIASITPAQSRSQALLSDKNMRTESGSLRGMSAPP